MKCIYCPLGSDEDVCPENEGKYGVEYEDGTLGCKHPRNWVEKRDREYANMLGEIGTDMGIEMGFSDAEFKHVIETCKHMIGLNYKKPYHRHGRAFYKPYRNYYCATAKGEPCLDKLPDYIIKKVKDDKFVWYTLTGDGFKWFGRQINVTIREREK